ncbi:hypothetical protein LV84_03030 [Algoriphagus ratkowskyi]|uniref:Uncharacterized protein n=1 Tax=Algoriphagus ratkowskyi TaxID=57028 RepID=A0A2W7STA0_9BACT|nr:hypothetical protein [Algoriphagus ratkowskyi]PZX53922.1 hypothetical protein LV84_03030 [Algoriphagus ratkowskyi]TXD76678.1 hypothetical protein ESW18_15045 [Algoriphagus ratkowskyi]
MKKQLSTVMISLSWVLWFAAVIAFPVDSGAHHFSHDSVSALPTHKLIQYNCSPELLEIPNFKVDWSLNAKLNPAWYVDLHFLNEVYLSPSFFKKSTPLFDVKDTFIHFFYTW